MISIKSIKASNIISVEEISDSDSGAFKGYQVHFVGPDFKARSSKCTQSFFEAAKAKRISHDKFYDYTLFFNNSDEVYSFEPSRKAKYKFMDEDSESEEGTKQDDSATSMIVTVDTVSGEVNLIRSLPQLLEPERNKLREMFAKDWSLLRSDDVVLPSKNIYINEVRERGTLKSFYLS
jgi:hypothetical protein